MLQTHGEIKGSVVLSIVTRNKTQGKDTTFLNSFLKVNAFPPFLTLSARGLYFSFLGTVSPIQDILRTDLWSQGIRLKPGLAEIPYIIP